ncbi:hypothetical protein ACC741_38610, partial [Rhizobium johnstonii]|uniref:hypothetical protein n=1 Tax=Rhizobium johnstonii TaxID=3019933 RepID=UPI003F9B785F
RRILLLLERVDAFEKKPDLTEQAVYLPEDRALIRRLGAEGAVLLKNDGIHVARRQARLAPAEARIAKAETEGEERLDRA